MKNLRTLLFIFWVIFGLIGIFNFASKAQANASFELTYTDQPGPLFNETNLAPNETVAKQITVKNLTDSPQKFALNLQNLIGVPDNQLADVLTVDISRAGNSLYNSKLSNLKDTETFIENIPAGLSYIYDIKVTLDDVGNEYQGQKVNFDLMFGWLEQGQKEVLGTSTGPLTGLPQTGGNDRQNWLLILIIPAIFILAFGWRFILKRAGNQ